MTLHEIVYCIELHDSENGGGAASRRAIKSTRQQSDSRYNSQWKQLHNSFV